MSDSDSATNAFRVDKFRTAHSEPAGIIVLELAQDNGAGFQFSMTHTMAQQIIKSLQEQIAKTKGKLN